MNYGMMGVILASVVLIPLVYAETSTECPQAMLCLNKTSDKEDSCNTRGVFAIMNCVGDLEGTCQLKQDRISFTEIRRLSLQMCLVTDNETDVSCEGLGPCMFASDIMRKLTGGTINPDYRPPVSLLVDSLTWCQYLETATKCYLNNTCPWSPSLRTYMTKQRDYLSTVCSSSSYGGQPAVVTWTLALLVTAVTSWSRSLL
ncbi:uncharacterized protein LOC143301431 [Babylonia areolata]|uniref:uncharacterized protein LOC143301431 n=1 Tax=Babylonia areolata TaxID=304850 RepID=UPI003FD2313A